MRIGFIDFSTEERNKVLSTLRLLDKQTALDELGIGMLRDFYADQLFPGISTIQTRAKYLVLIPYLFRQMEQQAGALSERDALAWLQGREDRLVGVLMANSPGENGIIGSLARKQKRAVKQKPSTIYWGALRTYGIVRADRISLATACRAAVYGAKRKKELEPKTDGETYDDSTAAHSGRALFSPLRLDYDLAREASIRLTRKEAEYIEEHIMRAPGSRDSLLAFLLRNRIRCESFDDIPAHLLPEGMARDYRLAAEFSRFIYGAHVRYNIIYANGCGIRDQGMEEEFFSWLEGISPCDLEPVLTRANCGYPLAAFCRHFLDAALRGDLTAMDELIIARERAVKGDRAKLCKPREFQYDPGRPIHFYPLDFRFNRAKVILGDILDGLEETSDV